MKLTKCFSMILCVLNIFILSSFNCFADEIEDAEKLYTTINQFLSINGSVAPEKFEDVCNKVIKGNVAQIKLLKQKEFSSIPNRILLYRGVDERRYADEIREGRYFISQWNVRGSGVYTTTSLDCARSFSDEKDSKTLITMAISRDNVKILNNDYLEKLKKIIVEKYKSDFGEFSDNKQRDYIFDNLAGYVDAKFMETNRKIEELLSKGLSDDDYVKQEQALLKSFEENIKKDPVFQELHKNRKKYYKSNKACVWFNSGLLAKLMGYDVLYTKGSLRDFFMGEEEEYLIVNPDILYILVD